MHVMSDEVEAHLVELLNNPGTYPHGNPIPGGGGQRDDLRALAETEPGGPALAAQLYVSAG